MKKCVSGAVFLFLLLFLCEVYLFSQCCTDLTLWPSFRVSHVVSILFDVSLLLLLCSLVFSGNLRKTAILSMILMLGWTVANVGYYRIFSQFIQLDSFGEAANNLSVSLILSYVSDFFQLSDLWLLPLVAGLVCVLRFFMSDRTFRLSTGIALVTPVVALAISVLSSPVCDLFFRYVKGDESREVSFISNHDISSLYNLSRNEAVYRFGFARTVFRYSIADLFPRSLSEERRKEISDYLDRKSLESSLSMNSPEGNVVFILLESFFSGVLGMKVDGEEVTPFLNALISSEASQSNLLVHQNIQNGMSADGQYIAMTGLLPLKNGYASSMAIRREVIALPEILRDDYGYSTAITIPTSDVIWRQKDVNVAYGIDDCAHSHKGEKWMNDDSLVDLALNHESSLSSPFFHLFLTVSTHGSYEELSDGVPFWDVDYPEGFSTAFSYYLSECRYMDSALEKYFSHLKDNGFYEGTTFVLLSDHLPLIDDLKMPEGSICEYIPFIVHRPGCENLPVFYGGESNQIDVYPTVLDILGIKSAYRGVGRSLVDPGYVYDVPGDAEWMMSYDILTGNFLKKQK